MKQQNPQLCLLAMEWARLHQRAVAEQDPAKIIAIVDRLKVLLGEAEELMGFKDEGSSQEADSDAMRDHTSSEKSGAGD